MLAKKKIAVDMKGGERASQEKEEREKERERDRNDEESSSSAMIGQVASGQVYRV